jgi:hypothetical protein
VQGSELQTHCGKEDLKDYALCLLILCGGKILRRTATFEIVFIGMALSLYRRSVAASVTQTCQKASRIQQSCVVKKHILMNPLNIMEQALERDSVMRRWTIPNQLLCTVGGQMEFKTRAKFH